MMFRGLRFVMAIGILMLAFGVGMVAEGKALPGAGLLLAGVLLGVVPFVLLLRALLGGGQAVASPAMADPALRRTARNLGAALLGWSLLPFLGAGALVFAFYRVPSSGGASAGAVAGLVVLGCALAMVPALLGFGFFRSGSLLGRGDVEGAAGGLRLNWILFALGALVAIASFSDDRPGYRTVAVVAAVVAAGALGLNLLLRPFLARVVAAEAQHLPPTLHDPDVAPTR